MPEMKISSLGTGSATSTNRAHTAMVYDCDDGTRLLIDTSSGNSVARGGVALGIPVEGFDKVLLSHHHPDHLSGLMFVQFSRARARLDAPPLDIMAIDNLPSMLPRESSEDFAGQLLPTLRALPEAGNPVWQGARELFDQHVAEV